MRAIIADDEQHLAEDLVRRLYVLWPELQIVNVVYDGMAAVAALTALKPDIAFLDIRMPGQNGLTVARSAAPECRVVFVTAYDDHAVQAFDQAAVDYLLKPVSAERLAKCVERLKKGGATISAELLSQLSQMVVQSRNTESLRWLRVQVGQTVRIIGVDEACYFQSTEKYTTLVTRDAELLLRIPIRDLISQLDPDQFWQIHRGTIVNIRQIVSAGRDLFGKVVLTLRDRKEKLAVSRNFAHLFRQM